MDNHLNEVLDQFSFKGKLVSCELFGSGHINTTFLAVYDDNGTEWKYVVQKVNTNVFKDIDHLMENVFSVTSYLRREIKNTAEMKIGKHSILSKPNPGISIIKQCRVIFIVPMFLFLIP